MPLINLNLWEGENKLHREIILPQSERQDLINKTKSGLIPLVPALLRKKARRQGDFCGSEVLYKANQGYTVRPSFKKKRREEILAGMKGVDKRNSYKLLVVMSTTEVGVELPNDPAI